MEDDDKRNMNNSKTAPVTTLTTLFPRTLFNTGYGILHCDDIYHLTAKSASCKSNEA